MPIVFVETNWVVACCAPAHNRVPAALELLERAQNGEISLHLPSLCLAEAQHPLRTKFQPRPEADRIRQYVTWALGGARIGEEDAITVRRVVDQMENSIRAELRDLNGALRQLSQAPGIHLLQYDHDMMSRAVEHMFVFPHIKPYDGAVLASVVVAAERLRQQGQTELFFCESDSDLQPWDKNGDRVDQLANVYDAANVWVYGDYLLESPPVPAGWHDRNRQP
ncbi:MAG: hypothetical protein ABSD20_14235 [Terriglobales bacterium]|jgi:hypothetical protein